jgi:hypothetical protein
VQFWLSKELVFCLDGDTLFPLYWVSFFFTDPQSGIDDVGQSSHWKKKQEYPESIDQNEY